MNKHIVLFLLAINLIIFSGCSKTNVDTNSQSNGTGNKIRISQSYTVDGDNYDNLNLYGTVIASNTKNLVSARGGKITQLNCQIGKKVLSKDVIASITPDFTDPNYQNIQIQKGSLQQQLSNLDSVSVSTISNFDIQISQLNNQKENNQNQLQILNSNLENLKKQKQLSSGDINTQTASLQDQIISLNKQIEYLENSKKLILGNKQKDLSKIEINIANQKKQILNSINSNLEQVDNVFGITDTNKSKNDLYEIYLSAKDSSLKTQVETTFLNINNRKKDFVNLSNDEISTLLLDASNLLKLASDAVNSSVSSTSFTQTQIDTLYSAFLNAATGGGLTTSVITLKTNFDNTVSSLETTANTYDNQLNNLDSSITNLQSNADNANKNLENLKTNKTELTFVNIDTSINTLNSQVQNLQSSNKNILEQIKSLQENKRIQISQLNNQRLTLKQNIEVLKNNASGENIIAGVDGIIRAKNADLGNKIGPNGLICQISPLNDNSLKLQIFSSKKINLGQEFSYYKNDVLLGTGMIEYESPYKDSATQNYIYETKINSEDIKEGDKLRIKINSKIETKDIFIPIEFVAPKLEGYFVKILSGNNMTELEIKVGDINNGYVQVFSGLNKGQIIVR